MAKKRAKAKGHRRSMFGDLSGGKRYQGYVSKAAAKRFELHRADLATLARSTTGWRGAVSDAAVIEYLVRGRSGANETLIRESAKIAGARA